MFFRKKKAKTAEEWINNFIRSVKLEDIIRWNIRLERNIDCLQSNIRETDTKIKMFLEMAKETESSADEISIATDIKMALLSREIGQYTLKNLKIKLLDASYLLILKENEKNLKSASVRKILSKLKPELETQQILDILEEHEEDLKSELGIALIYIIAKWVAFRNMTEEDIEEFLNTLESIRNSWYLDKELEYINYLMNNSKCDSQNEEGLSEILDVIRSVKRGEIDVEDAVKILKKEKEKL